MRLGTCSCCKSEKITLRYSEQNKQGMITCDNCGNWTWLEDAKNSCWIKEDEDVDPIQS